MRRLLEPGALARPGVGVERVVLVGPEHVAAEALRAALGDQPQLAGRRAAVLRLIVRGQHLHLGDGVEVLRAHHEAAGGADADRRRAVDGGHELVGAAAVDRRDAGGERAGAGRHRAAHVAADDAGRQLRDLRRAASAERRFRDLLGAHRAADHRRIHERRRRLDLDGLAQRADLERDVDADVDAGVDRHARLGDRLEAGQRRGDAVVADRHVGEGVEPRLVGHRPALDAGADADERDVHAGQHAAGGVLHDAGDLRRVELRRGGTHRAAPDTPTGACANS